MKRFCIIFFLLFLVPAFAFTASINVYVRLDDPLLRQSVSEFNNELKQRGILERYGVEPFLNHHPMHATLYLTEYSKDRIEQVVEVVRQLACHSKPVQLKINGMSVTKGNYVMLDVNNAVTSESPSLQQLSNQATLKLSGLRDYNAPIPDWAKFNPGKRKAFERYGSPNVFLEFNPHLSLMAPDIKDEDKSRAFRDEVQAVIDVWSFPHLTIDSAVLGVGYTNAQGQVIEEIARFNLDSCQK